MSRRRVALAILGDALLLVVIILLFQIDQLVNGTLYGYGLVFSNDWAQPYWLLMRVSLALIIVAVILITLWSSHTPRFKKTKQKPLKQRPLLFHSLYAFHRTLHNPLGVLPQVFNTFL
jgi:hypothetical protein